MMRSRGPVVAGLSNFDDVAELPGSRLTTFKASLASVPVWSSIPAERRVTVAASTKEAYQTALNTAAALTGGHRLVIVPTNFNAKLGDVVYPPNVDFPNRVWIVWEKIVSGEYSYARGQLAPYVAPAGMPLFETQTVGAGAQLPIFHFPVAATPAKGYMFVGLHTRTAADAPDDGFGSGYCPALVDVGGFNASGVLELDVSRQPTDIAFLHCVMGGRKFNVAGKWRKNNLGRLIYANGGAVAMLDCWDVEHGAMGSGGSDRGIVNGVVGLGPLYVNGCATDFGGGICFMSGGADRPNDYPNDEDMEVSDCWIERRQMYNPSNTTHRLADGDGLFCPWTQKNQYETKTQGRTLCERNVFIGQWTDGQTHTIVLKAVQQNGAGRVNATYDCIFRHNIVLTGASGLAHSTMESYAAPPNTVNGLARLSVHDNIFVCGMSQSFPTYSNGTRRDAMFLSHGGTTPLGTLAGPLSYFNNLFMLSPEIGPSGNEVGRQLLMAGNPISYGNAFKLVRNVFIGIDIYNWGFASDYGNHMNALFSGWGSGSTFNIVDNVRETATGTAPSGDSTFSADQFYCTGAASIGLVPHATIKGQFTVDTGSILLDGADGGARIGPNFTAMAALQNALIARAYP